MRISFPNKEREDTLVGPGDTRIGASAENSFVVRGNGVALHHIGIRSGDRGIELRVLDGQARTHVNTRPVREKAILRLGDVISLGSVQLVLKPDRDEDIRTHIPAPATPSTEVAQERQGLPARVVLRGLSGTHFGKIVPVRERVVIGAQGDLQTDDAALAARHAAIEVRDGEIVLRGLDAANSFVNGVATRNAVLHGGDQVVFGRERFLIEAPGMAARAVARVATAVAHVDAPTARNYPAGATAGDAAALVQEPPERAHESGKNDIWWLIVAAALIAGVFALFFLGVF